MTNDEIAHLRELDKVRTEGTYSLYDNGMGGRSVMAYIECGSCGETHDAEVLLFVSAEDDDLAYIVAACNALPGLLDEVEVLQKQVKWFNDVLMKYSDLDACISVTQEAIRNLTDEALQGGVEG